MSNKRKLWLTTALALLCALLLAMPAMALPGESTQASPFIAEGDGVVYAVFPSDSGATLATIPAAGGEPTTLESSSVISNLIYENGTLYYFNKQDNAMQLMKRDADGASVMLRFTDNSVAGSLLWYEGALYMLVDDLPYKVDPQDNQMSALLSTTMSEFIIQSDIIYYVSKVDTKDYEVASTEDSPLTATAGKLHSVNLDGSEDEVAFAEGVSKLHASGMMLYFHSYADPYVMGDSEQWIEGTLTRLDLGTGEVKTVGPDYDWEYFAVPDGAIAYQMDSLTLYDLDGGTRQIGQPQGFCSIGVIGNNVYVLDTASGKLTRADYTLDAEAVTLCDALPVPITDEGSDVDEGDDTDETDEDTASDSSSDDDEYVLPSSSTHKLSDSLLERLSLSTLGYARNEILARHGYVFKTAKYKNHFNGKSWYKPGGFSYNDLNSIERYNVERIKDYEAKKSGTKRKGATVSGYIFKDSNKKRLTDKQVSNLDADMLPYARNEILARHGYQFKTKAYRDYFMKRTWYTPGGYKASSVSATEWDNINLIKQYEKSGSSSPGSDKSYIFPKSNTKKLTKAQVRKLSKSKMGYARNEILARHGYVFTTKKYKNYFAKKSWYKAGGYKESKLNNTEWYNIDLIKECEDE